jgi:hypothetical protein
MMVKRIFVEKMLLPFPAVLHAVYTALLQEFPALNKMGISYQ